MKLSKEDEHTINDQYHPSCKAMEHKLIQTISIGRHRGSKSTLSPSDIERFISFLHKRVMSQPPKCLGIFDSILNRNRQRESLPLIYLVQDKDKISDEYEVEYNLDTLFYLISSFTSIEIDRRVLMDIAVDILSLYGENIDMIFGFAQRIDEELEEEKVYSPRSLAG